MIGTLKEREYYDREWWKENHLQLNGQGRKAVGYLQEGLRVGRRKHSRQGKQWGQRVSGRNGQRVSWLRNRQGCLGGWRNMRGVWDEIFNYISTWYKGRNQNPKARVGKLSLAVKSSSLPIFIKFYWNIITPIHLHAVYGCFSAKNNICYKDHVVCKA